MGVIEARRRILLSAPHPVTTTPASVASFDTDMVGKLRSAKFGFLPVQSGSGDPSPDNVRPISGWTGANVYTAGTNLVPCSDGDYTASDTTRLICENGVFTLSNRLPYPLGISALISQQGGTVETVFGNRKRLFPGTYSFSVEITGLVGTTAVDGIYLELTDGVVEVKARIPNNSTVTISEPLDILQIRCALTGGYPAGASISFKVQLERSSSPSAWKPYQGTTYPVSWQSAGTIYGGYVDLVRGEVVAEYGIVDLGTLDWYNVDTSYGKVAYSITLNKVNAAGANEVYFCDRYKYKGICTSNNDASLYGSGSCSVYTGPDKRFYINDSSFAEYTNAQVKAALNGVQLVYPLATPITYALTPQIIKSLRGANNLWSTGNGNTTITYWTH